jgi:monofunctional biosynthetic peptidoglycan transglycosylase
MSRRGWPTPRPGAASSRRWLVVALRGLALLAVCGAAVQCSFAIRIATMAVFDPTSTAFQRSQAWRLWSEGSTKRWQQEWVELERISVHLPRAVIASEDATFMEHRGVDWTALEKAWGRHQQHLTPLAASTRPGHRGPPRRWGGGSTITQQLAKNLFLSGERTVLRKAQELVITTLLETFLDKRRLMEIYLNHVEWGEGVFGAQAAARHHFRVNAGALQAGAAARLAVMLPAPRRFERIPSSPYIAARSATILARMDAVDWRR